ncbi:MAG: hypothetical protein HFE78_08075 [Clostridiales bacterium]|nr:hypothetical protein [Clostridiales bacterium]
MKKLRIAPLSFVSYPALFLFCGPGTFAYLLGACALHEAGHFIAIKAKHLTIESFSITPAGLDIKRFGACAYRTDALICAAGPLAGLLAALFSYLFGLEVFAAINLCCTLLNLLPIMPLDGGLALRYTLLAKIDYSKADSISRAVALTFLFIVYVFAVILLLYTEWNLTLLLLCTVIFCGYLSAEK